MSTPISENDLALIRQAIFSGEKIQAIKLYRRATKAGLAEAKTAVEKMESELRAASPERFTTAPSAGKGCLAVMAVVCATALLTILFFKYR